MNQRLIELDQQQDAIMLKLQKKTYCVETNLFTQLNEVLQEKNTIYKQQLQVLRNEKA